MDQVLILKERVENTIQLGESHYREFKSALFGPPSDKKPRPTKDVCRDIGEALVAFANADGGELLVGVEDDGSISGIPHSDEDIERMLSAPESHVHQGSKLPISHATKIDIDNRHVLFFAVSKGVAEIYQLPDGRCVRRRDRSSEPETVGRILFERQETASREYDRQFVDGAGVMDLDMELVRSIADKYLRGISAEHYLQQVGLAEYSSGGFRLRMAALLLFAKEIQRWHPRSQVRILKVAGIDLKSGEHYNVVSDETEKGNIFQLLRSSWEKLRPFLAYKTEFGQDARFEQRYVYPEWACREALTNAIAHRAYNIINGVDLFIFDDRMEIKSPGSLLSTLTLENLRQLRGAHETRNALIARILSENNFMRELGEGMKRMFELMEQNELKPPALDSDANSFSITLHHKSVFTEQQEQWLGLFHAKLLTNRQKKIVLLGMDQREIAPHDIYRAMNTDDRDTYDREVTALRNAGILLEIRTNPAATLYSRKHNISKSKVPRFRVALPGATAQPLSLIEKATDAAPSPTQRRNVTGGAQPESRSKMPPNPDCCVFVHFGSSPQLVTQEEIIGLFGRCGRIRYISLPTITGSDIQKGFGFVWYDSPDSATRSVKELNGQVMSGRRLNVRHYAPKSQP